MDWFSLFAQGIVGSWKPRLRLRGDDVRALISGSRLTSESISRQVEHFLSPQFRHRAERLFEELKRDQVGFTYPGHPLYPIEFLQLQIPPLFLTYMGQPTWRTRPYMAVVGSRRPQTGALWWMKSHLSECLRELQVGVVSGGALGVDQFAHEVALNVQVPTLCLLPSGYKKIYPSSLSPLLDRILDAGGAWISPFHPTANVRRAYFRSRNDLIVAISSGVFVVEANRRSGSWMTGGLALAQGRPLFTIPVSPWSEQGLGNNDLIEFGATPLLHGRDLLERWNDLSKSISKDHHA